MEYQKIANLLNDVSNKPSKFKKRNWVEINDDIRSAYSPNKQIRFKTVMLRSSLCDYRDAYILVKGNILVNNTAAAGAAANNTNKKVPFKNCAPFTNCISKINNTQIDNAEYIDKVMPMYNLIEYSDNYSKTFGSLWQYCKEIAAVNNAGDIINLHGANAVDSFNFKTKIIGQMGNNGRIYDVEIMVPLKYLSNLWKTLEIPLIDCEVEVTLIWSAHVNGRNKTHEYKNRTYYFYNDVINLDEFEGSKIKVDRKIFNYIDIYYLGYEYKKQITEFNEINTVNLLYLRIEDMKGQF